MIRRQNFRDTVFRTTIVLSIFLPGCSIYQKNQFLKQEFRTEAVSVPFTLTKVLITDRRKDVSDEPLKIPNVNFVRKHIDHQPALTDSIRGAIQEELTRYFAGGTNLATANAEILSGVKKFSMSGMRERETVSVEIKVTLLDSVSRQPFVWSTGAAEQFIESVDASAEYLEKLYERAVRMSIYQAMKSLSHEFSR